MQFLSILYWFFCEQRYGIVIPQHLMKLTVKEEIDYIWCSWQRYICTLFVALTKFLMLSNGFRRLRLSRLTHRGSYSLLDHKKMDDLKKKLYTDRQKTMMLKLKFILKEAKYTIVEGSKDLWQDAKWITTLYRNKQVEYFTGFQLSQSRRIKIDLLKFIPYSVILVVPFAELALPIILWLFPNAAPSHYLFDEAEDRRIEKCQQTQFQSHKFLIQKLINTMMERFKLQPAEFSRYQFFKEGYFEIIDDLDKYLDFNKFNSDELIRVLEFMGGGDFVTGTSSVNKIVNLFTLNIPRLVYKVMRWTLSKALRKDFGAYKDPWFIRGNFPFARFNYFPFQILKRKFLIWQINRKFRNLWLQDRAFQIYGMEDVTGNHIKYIARQRGMATLSCYQTLRNVVKNDWVKFTTHPKFKNNNSKLWYSVMMYNFLKQSSRQIN